MTTQTATKRQPARNPSVAKAKPKVAPTDARVWLRQNAYDDVADLIDEVTDCDDDESSA